MKRKTKRILNAIVGVLLAVATVTGIAALVNHFKADEDGFEKVNLTYTIGELDESGRRSVSEIKDSEVYVPCDYVVIAIGSSVEKLDDMIERDRRNRIMINESNKTSADGIYAGGDAVNGPLTVVHAMRQGREAAESILRQFNVID